MANDKLKQYMQEMSAEDKMQLVRIFQEYDNAKKNNGDIQGTYQAALCALKDMEKQSGKTIFMPVVPEEKIVDLFTQQLLEKLQTVDLSTKKPEKPAAAEQPVAPQPSAAHYSCSFNTLAEANDWLAKQKNIIVTHMQVDTSRTSLDVTKVRLEYRISQQDTHKIYQLCEERHHRFFAKSKPEVVRKKWQEKHPAFTYVTSIKKTWRISSFGTTLGFFRYINENYIILFTVKTA